MASMFIINGPHTTARVAKGLDEQQLGNAMDLRSM